MFRFFTGLLCRIPCGLWSSLRAEEVERRAGALQGGLGHAHKEVAAMRAPCWRLPVARMASR